MTCKFINADEPSIIATNPYNILSVFAFDYCNNNPVMYVDKDGYIGVSAVIGAIIGFGAGAIFLPMLASKWGLTGWKKKIFIALGTGALTVIGGLLGHYAGKAIVALYSKGGSFSTTLNKAIAKTISKFTKASYSTAKGNGFILKLKNIQYA